MTCKQQSVQKLVTRFICRFRAHHSLAQQSQRLSLTTIDNLDPSNSIAQAAQQVQVSEGAIALPYFQSLPGETGAGIVTGSWSGSTSLEEDLNENLAPGQTVFSFLRDIDGTLNVNGYFPFPEQNATTTVPVVVFSPVLDGSPAQPTACMGTNGAGKPEGVTIFQHGITVDRSVSMLPAILLAQSACQTVVGDRPATSWPRRRFNGHCSRTICS